MYCVCSSRLWQSDVQKSEELLESRDCSVCADKNLQVYQEGTEEQKSNMSYAVRSALCISLTLFLFPL